MVEKPEDIKVILAEAMEKSTATERSAYLDGVCRGDADLRQEVESLLRLEDKVGDFLESPILDGGTTLDNSAVSEGPGTVMGQYKLLEKIGEGGMAVVYMAEQDKPVRRKVALKIIKVGMDTKSVIARFEAERQALAMMDHPNIAKVLDAGATETGRPYFVMDLVPGLPITEYCNKNRLSINERLRLFVVTCNAVQHAHQKGIIHRDVKPSNVIVTRHDGVAVPKVIDFGIAKATNQRLTEKTLFTRFAHIIGTPAYMSPEQAELSDLDIDTRTDVYSLGVLLYELLTGATPLDGEDLRSKGYAEMQRIIQEEEPPKPSTKLSTIGETLTGVAAQRSSSPDSLRKSLKGDLDWIVMKCLEKNRTRRYDTANGLASDIKRHLDNEPVIARPPSTVYRFQKAWKRNRVVFSTAALIAVTLLAGGLVSSVLAIREQQARQRESGERERALHAEQQATELAQRYRRLSYVSDVSLAGQIYESGDLARATALLQRHLPTEKEEDLRGIGWRYLWEVCQGNAVRAVPRTGMVEVAYAPDGLTFATGGSNGMIRIWDRDTLMQKAELSVDPDPHGQYRRLDLLYAPSGDKLAGLSRNKSLHDDSGQVVLLDVDGGDPWHLAHGSPNSVVQIAFKDHGNTLITAEREGQVRFWNASTGQPIGKALQLEPGATWRRAAFSSDLRLLAAGGPKKNLEQPETNQLPDVQVNIYDLETGVRLSELQTDQIGKLQFTENSQYLINPGKGGKLVVWEIATGQEVFSDQTFECCSGVTSISDDQVAVGTEDAILFVNPAERRIVKRWDGIPGIVHDLALSPDGNQLVSAGWDGMVRLWDLPRKENPMTVELDTPATECLSFSPDGNMLASAYPADSAHPAVVLRDAFSFKELYRFEGQTRPVFSPSGACLATVSGDANDVSIHFWDCRSGQQIGAPVLLEGHNMGPPRGGVGPQLAWSTNGRLIGCATRDRVIILDVAKRRILPESKIPSTAGRRYLAFGANEDGQDLIAMPAGIRTVKLVNLDDGNEQVLVGPTGEVWGAFFSPDGRRLVSIGDDIFVWNTHTGKVELSIKENTSAVSQVVFSPDGGSILSRAWTGSLSLWDLQSGREKMRFLESYKQTLQSIAISSDGMRIIAGVNKSTLKVWSAPRMDLVPGITVETR